MSDDPARDYEVLRRQTAAMLNLDLADLSPADGLRLDLTALLRLSLDSLQGAALAGREVDLSRLQSCFAMLQKLLPQSVAAPQLREDFSARRKLTELINNIAEVIEDDESAQITELEAEVAQLKAEIDGKNATIIALGGSIAAKQAVVEQAPSPSPAPAAPPEQTTSPPEPQRSPQ
jgi:DNA-directed RNA polymerase specialized sigma54-like protein